MTSLHFDVPKNRIIYGYCGLCSVSYKDKIGSTGDFHKHARQKRAKEYAQHRERGFNASDAEGNVGLEYEDR